MPGERIDDPSAHFGHRHGRITGRAVSPCAPPWTTETTRLLLGGTRHPGHVVARIAGVSERTIRNARHAYEQGAPKGSVRLIPVPRPPHSIRIRTRFANPLSSSPHTVQEAVQRIDALTDVQRSPTAVRTWLKNGFVFSENRAHPSPSRYPACLFVDAARFVLSAWLGSLRGLARVLWPTPSGRQRFHVLGALPAMTHEMVTVTNETDIDRASMVELFEKLAARFTDHPITVVLDHARYPRHDAPVAADLFAQPESH